MHGYDRAKGSGGRFSGAGLAGAALAALLALSGARVEAQDVIVQTTPAPTQDVVVQTTPAPAQPQVIYVQEPAPTRVYVQTEPAPATPPPRARRSRGPNIGLIVSGAIMLGSGWLANVIVSLPAGDDPFSSAPHEQWNGFRVVSLVPIAGPWIQIGVKPTGFFDDYWAMWLIIDGLLQTAGTAMLIGGIATSGGEEEIAWRDGDVRLSIAPSAGPHHAGLALHGTF